MRPQSIVLFERITFAAFFAGLLNGALNWGALLDRTANISAHPAILLVLSLALGFLVTASL
ncbi:hypothetical protein, partial [Citrobacter freundii]|uniref:hypothetical protein n=3 Tax=Pseudomonadota TaxID=1224 RepID=UPI0013D4EDCA